MNTEAHYYMILNVGTFVTSATLRRYKKHMLLAQQYASKGAYDVRYRSLIKEMAQSSQHHLIMDNGAHEGIDIDLDTYKLILSEVKPDVAVLPDLVGRPSQESFELSLRFRDWIEKYLPHTNYMFAAQGQDKESILNSYQRALNEFEPSKCIIGFGQAYLTWETEQCKQEEARRDLIQDLLAQNNMRYMERFRYHILGGRWAPMKVTSLSARRNHTGLPITGIDSVKPLTSVRSHELYPKIGKAGTKTDLCDHKESLGSIILSRSIDRFVEAYGLAPIDWAKLFQTSSCY